MKYNTTDFESSIFCECGRKIKDKELLIDKFCFSITEASSAKNSSTYFDLVYTHHIKFTYHNYLCIRCSLFPDFLVKKVKLT